MSTGLPTNVCASSPDLTRPAARGQKRGQKKAGSVSRGPALRLPSARKYARFLERATGIEPATFSLGMRYARVSRRFEGTV